MFPYHENKLRRPSFLPQHREANQITFEEITWLINSIISIIVGLLCGGSGVALIASGPTGIFTGMMISILVLALGNEKMEELLLKTDLPRPLRKVLSKNTIESRLDAIDADVRSNLYYHLDAMPAIW